MKNMQEVLQQVDEIGIPSGSLWGRMIRAARLDAAFYEEIKEDGSATTQAFKALMVACAATGIGWGISIFIKDGMGLLSMTLLVGFALALSTWLLGSYAIYLVSTKLLRTGETQATFKGTLRAIGFANAPNTIGILLFVPFLGPFIFLLTLLWTFVADVIAVREVFSFSTSRAVVACIVGPVLAVSVIVAPFLTLAIIAKLA
ncbi:MAG: Yip1 family protein [Dehalococcoidia bacterium]|nr:Yip1 family protein [Dehalococcoidia bacterium]